MKKIKFFVLFFVVFCNIISAQSADKVTEMIEVQTVNLEEVAYFASSYYNIIDETEDNIVALTELKKYFQYDKITTPETALSYEDFAYFCTQTWNIKGGLMLMATKSPRYAFKELQFMGYIPQSIDPSTKIDGIQALTIMTNCIEFAEINQTIDFDLL